MKVVPGTKSQPSCTTSFTGGTLPVRGDPIKLVVAVSFTNPLDRVDHDVPSVV